MPEQTIPWRRQNPNDEPVYEDSLGHHALARQLGDGIIECTPPYVVGVQGAWGSGKTSFLRKLWAYLGGETPHPKESLQRWFGQYWSKPEDVHPVWFNPWQHQFESSPMVALLQEIRSSFSRTSKFLNEAKKLTDVTVYSALSVLGDLGGALPKLSPKTVMERGREYEAEHFTSPLSSQRFRDFFEAAIRQVITKKGRLVVFIDDLDRCEGEVAYRLLESLKLYLNAKNCVYVLGLDQKHLEETIARVLSDQEATWRYRPLAREYLGKMFQCQFLLPVTPEVHKFIEELLNLDEDTAFAALLQRRFGIPPDSRKTLIQMLDGCLPHNPRKIKAFLAAWRLYARLLAEQKPGEALDWRVTLVLNYLAQFEEPLYRKVEEAPGFFRDEIVKFCRLGESSPQFRPLLEGLELPYGTQVRQTPSGQAQASEPESFGVPAPRSKEPAEVAAEAPSPAARVFWVRDLIVSLDRERPALFERESIVRHLLRAQAAVQ
jgi:hypothetical protein